MAIQCPSCGGPLPRYARWVTATCPFCGSTVGNAQRIVKAADFKAALLALDADDPTDPSLPKLRLGALPYRVEGLLGEGRHSDVFLASRARRLTERVVLRIVRPDGEQAALDRSWAVLKALQESKAQGSTHLSTRVPQPIWRGNVDPIGKAGLLTRFPSGFVHTLAQIRHALPGGLDPRHGVWMWRRMLELLGWLHRSGWAHGSISPEHLLIHARDHGVLLVGWSSAIPLLRGGEARADLVAAAAAVVYALGGSPSSGPPECTPAPLRELLLAALDPRGGTPDDAWQQQANVSAAGRACFGPPRYVPLRIPGWP